MSMLGFKSSGSFKNLEAFAKRVTSRDIYRDLDRYGKMGVDALARATPYESGETARSWTYEIVRTRGNVGISWYNTHTNDGANIAILLQYGHGTGTGGYVQGENYINPAIRPIFDEIAANVWKKVSR